MKCFFLSWQTRCLCRGIEYDERIYRAALKNKDNSVSGAKVELYKTSAEMYNINEYIAYLMSVDELMFLDEIDCRDLFEGEDKRERILIFGLGMVDSDVFSLLS